MPDLSNFLLTLTRSSACSPGSQWQGDHELSKPDPKQERLLQYCHVRRKCGSSTAGKAKVRNVTVDIYRAAVAGLLLDICQQPD
jgi:hypothetical protein